MMGPKSASLTHERFEKIWRFTPWSLPSSIRIVSRKFEPNPTSSIQLINNPSRNPPLLILNRKTEAKSIWIDLDFRPQIRTENYPDLFGFWTRNPSRNPPRSIRILSQKSEQTCTQTDLDFQLQIRAEIVPDGFGFEAINLKWNPPSSFVFWARNPRRNPPGPICISSYKSET